MRNSCWTYHKIVDNLINLSAEILMKSTAKNLVVSYPLWAGVQAATAASASMPKLLRSMFHGFLVVVMGIGYISSQFLNRIILDDFSPYWCFVIYTRASSYRPSWEAVPIELRPGSPRWIVVQIAWNMTKNPLVSLGHVSFVGYSTVYTFLFFGLGDKDYVHRMLRWEFWPSMMMGCNICVRVICQVNSFTWHQWHWMFTSKN